ncbi:MAG: hypothetical protein R2795_26355 [Saprospiraceae bacterium]
MEKGWNVGAANQSSGLAKETENVLLVGLILRDQTEQLVNEHLDELEFLALTAGAVAVKRFIQKMDSPHPRTFVGKGKLEEIGRYIESHENITAVVFDDDLPANKPICWNKN